MQGLSRPVGDGSLTAHAVFFAHKVRFWNHAAYVADFEYSPFAMSNFESMSRYILLEFVY